MRPEVLEAFLDLVPDAVVIVDIDGRIVFVNAQTESMFGYPGDALIGQPVEMLMPDRYRETHVVHRARYIQEPATRPMGAGLDPYGLRKDGTEFPVQISLSSFEAEGAVLAFAAVRDVTDQRRISEDISERTRTEEILRKNEEKFRAFLEFAPDAVVIVDGKGKIVLVNVQAEHMFGYERAELLGEPVEQLLPDRFRDAHVHHRLGYLAEPQVRPMGAGLDLFGLRKNGVEFSVDISLSPLETEEGTLLAAAIRDVSERKRLEALRDQFIVNAAHELRTPMATLAMLGGTLASHLHEMSAEQIAESLAALRRQGERATTSIANLLNLSEIEGGRIVLNMRDVRIADVITRVLETAPHPDGVSVDVIVQEDLCVVADPLRLEQVITNLVTNVYRYGGRHARIEAAAKNASVEIAVSDDGAGVPADLIPDLFHPFTRGKTARATGGSGIGLALCHGLMQAMGGEIRYETAHPHGSRFVVQLKSAS